MSDAHEFLNALLDGLREEAQVKRPERRMNRGGSSNSDKENIQQGAVEPSTSAELEPSEEEICDKETKLTYVEDMFEHQLETTRVCMICEKVRNVIRPAKTPRSKRVYSPFQGLSKATVSEFHAATFA